MGKSRKFQCRFCGMFAGSRATNKRHENMRCPKREGPMTVPINNSGKGSA